MLARFALSALFALFAAVATAIAGSGPAHTVRVSVSSNGAQTPRQSHGPSLSETGRFVVFASWAHDLVAHDTNGRVDVFVHDTTTRKTKRVSLSSSGRQGNDRSFWPSISSNGRFVAFQSRASTLAPGDGDKEWDVFLRDLKRNETTLVSVQPDGKHGGVAPFISADGRSVAFEGPNGGIFVRNLTTHRTERVPGRMPSLSGDGRLVAFTSYREFATPVPRSGSDVFVEDLKTHTTEQVSVSPYPEQTDGWSDRPRISANGRFVVFASTADLVHGEPNGGFGMYRRDIEKHTTERVGLGSNGNEGNNGPFSTAISANGRFIAFGSYATNLVPGDTNDAQDVFVHDVATRTTTRVSVSDSGNQASSDGESPYYATSENPAISGDGRFVAFQSRAPNLVRGDTNKRLDVFVRGPLRP